MVITGAQTQAEVAEAAVTRMLASVGDCSAAELRRDLETSKAIESKLAAYQARAAATLAALERHGDGGAGVLRHATGMSRRQAENQARTARVLEDMPGVREALESGRVSFANAARLAQAAEGVEAGAVEADASLLAKAESMTDDQFAREARRWTASHQPDHGEADYQRRRARRWLRLWDGDGGMTQLRGELDPVTGERIRNRLEAEARRLRRSDSGNSCDDGPGPGVGSGDGKRSFAQAMADALDGLTDVGSGVGRIAGGSAGGRGPAGDSDPDPTDGTADDHTGDSNPTDGTADNRTGKPATNSAGASARTNGTTRDSATPDDTPGNSATPAGTSDGGHPAHDNADNTNNKSSDNGHGVGRVAGTSGPGRPAHDSADNTNNKSSDTSVRGPAGTDATTAATGDSGSSQGGRGSRGRGDRSGNRTASDSDGVCDCGRKKRGGRPIADIAVVSHVDSVTGELVSQLATGEPLPPSVLDLLSCNAALTGVLYGSAGTPLWRGTTKRTATAAQLRALIARDGGCIGCGCHPALCQAHHIRPVALGGRTTIANMTLLCWDCHNKVHHNQWQVLRRNGRLVLEPPVRTRWGPARAP